jgi:hypothetical protein
MISWQILQRVAILLHQGLHEGLAIVMLTRNNISSHALSGVLVQAGLVPTAQPSLLTYLYSPTRQHAGIGRCPDCILDMLASH